MEFSICATLKSIRALSELVVLTTKTLIHMCLFVACPVTLPFQKLTFEIGLFYLVFLAVQQGLIFCLKIVLIEMVQAETKVILDSALLAESIHLSLACFWHTF